MCIHTHKYIFRGLMPREDEFSFILSQLFIPVALVQWWYLVRLPHPLLFRSCSGSHIIENLIDAVSPSYIKGQILKTDVLIFLQFFHPISCTVTYVVGVGVRCRYTT